MPENTVLDPVDAYDRIAPRFAEVSRQRRAYLDQIDRLIVSEIPPGSRSLLDVGAGDGKRSFRIAEAAGVSEVVLIEPSAAMRGKWPAGTSGWPVRAEDLSGEHSAFDVITCLWNVLGHIFPVESRLRALGNCAHLLAPRGRLFIDVSHRYNAAHYGIIPTIARMAEDLVRPNEHNGDVTVRWDFNDLKCVTEGHVFTDTEFRRLAAMVGLRVGKRIAVDYSKGRIRRSKFAGHLLYVLTKD